MKQRITAEQLGELNDAQKTTIKAWWKAEEGDRVVEFHAIAMDGKTLINYVEYTWEDEFIYDEVEGPRYYPLLTIGQMIEFIGNRDIDLSLCPLDDRYEWAVKEVSDSGWMKTKRNAELCDALWEVVKTKLK